MADDLGVFVVQRQTDQVWEANCINVHCGHGMHGVAESSRRSDVDGAATRHRDAIRQELAAIKEREAREPIDWQARAEQAEQRLAVVTSQLREMRHSCTCGPRGLVLIDPTGKETANAQGQPS